ncbi:thiamine-phosphate kinase [Pleurocapsales cyanobacterium LEGE 06147]|nr:thiamine-phosphate kinase [Pleurocapsales cyanobacterium LEGE 06147]
MNHSPQLVKDIKEQGLLQKLQAFCPKDIVGDDGAVFLVNPGYSLVVTTDVLVEEVHFSDRTTTAFDVGWRAAAANLSDLAAMGAEPLGITVGLSLPGDLAVSWVEELYQGLARCLQQYRTSIVGGDICRSATITVAIAAFGQVLPHRVIRRQNARPGDAIVTTGFHGLSRAGLELLLHPEKGRHLEKVEQQILVRAHQQPRPRLDVLPHLWEAYPESRIGGMDSSDGLADAVLQICRCSGVGAKIERNCLPVSPALSKLVSAERALEWSLYGGEDFELILCLPPSPAQILVEKIGSGAAIIGTITTEQKILLIDSSSSSPAQILTLAEGFQHF